MRLFSQVGQDSYVLDRYFRAFIGGTFVDIGAHDGITFSNTYFFERYLGWKGMCFEPLPSAYELLKQNRSSICMPFAICDYDGIGNFCDVEVENDGKMLSGLTHYYDPRHMERINNALIFRANIDVEVRSLNPLLREHRFERINYLSIDTEGSELSILNDIDFKSVVVDIISVENNYDDRNIRDLLN